MKTTWKSLIVALVLVASFTTKAQDRKQADPQKAKARVEQQAQKIAEAIKLDADKTSKLKTILLTQAEQMIAAREKTGGDRKAMRSEMMAQRDKTEKDIQALFSKEEYAAFLDYRTKQRNQMMQRRAERQNMQGGEGADLY